MWWYKKKRFNASLNGVSSNPASSKEYCVLFLFLLISLFFFFFSCVLNPNTTIIFPVTSYNSRRKIIKFALLRMIFPAAGFRGCGGISVAAGSARRSGAVMVKGLRSTSFSFRRIPCAAFSSLSLLNNTSFSHIRSPCTAGMHTPRQQFHHSALRLVQNNTTNNNAPAGGAVEAEEETHPDFQPRAINTEFAAEEIEMIKKDIDETIRTEDVVLFIKGVPEAPMCAFSKKMIDVVECLGLEYTSFDVLAHPVVRSYVKEVSEWPTIPQLFVKGAFTGGLDIILQMAEKGDLQMLLDSKGIKHRDQQKQKEQETNAS